MGSVVGTEIAAIAATANTNRDGTGTLATIFTAPTLGSRIESIFFKATGVTTAGMLRLYIDNGTIKVLRLEIPVDAVASPSGTVETWDKEWIFGDESPLWLPASATLKAAPHNAEAFVATTTAVDFT